MREGILTPLLGGASLSPSPTALALPSSLHEKFARLRTGDLVPSRLQKRFQVSENMTKLWTILIVLSVGEWARDFGVLTCLFALGRIQWEGLRDFAEGFNTVFKWNPDVPLYPVYTSPTFFLISCFLFFTPWVECLDV